MSAFPSEFIRPPRARNHSVPEFAHAFNAGLFARRRGIAPTRKTDHRVNMLMVLMVCIPFIANCNAQSLTLSPQYLRCEYRINPLGIDVAQPRLSWTSNSSVRGDSQTAYEIQVASSPSLLAQGTGDLWDSGKVSSAQQNHLLYAGAALETSQKVYWQVRAWNAAGVVSLWSPVANWTMGILSPAAWQASWITGPQDTNQSSLFRKEFNVATGLTRALINVSGMGQYEMSLNGTKVGPNFLTPGWTTYSKTCLYDTYDVTSMLQQSGTNAIGLMLGNGMYNVSSSSAFGTRYSDWTGTSGPRKAIVQIRLEYSNGTLQIIGSDNTWSTTTGPITYCSIYGGEDYDARLYQAGWNVAGFNASTWSAATLFSGSGGQLQGSSGGALPLSIHQVFQPVRATLLSKSTVVYDFGQNAAQIPQISVTGPAGSRVQLVPGELLNSNGTVTQASASNGSSAIGSYMDYTLAGSGTETYSPRFYYYGYRYIQANLYDSNGLTTGTLPAMVSIQSSAISTTSTTAGSFSCSNSLFNNIRTLVDWAQSNNEVSYLTDCPHREKMGWLEQDYLNGPSLRYEHDLTVLYNKELDDMAEGQYASGLVPDNTPLYRVYGGAFTDSPEWGSAIIQVPWQEYMADGDPTPLSLHYNTMKAYLAYLTSKASSDNILNYGLGDWFDLGPNAPGVAQLTPLGVTATATYYLDAQTMAQIATLLGESADAASFTALANKIQSSFNAEYFNPLTFSYATGSQTANAMPLAVGLVAPSNVPGVVDSLIKSVQVAGTRLTSGDIGYRYLLRALTDNGHADIVFTMNNQSETPGYGYMLAQGATACTEAWNTNPSDSQDHFMLGQIIEWFYHDLAGIAVDPAGPGYQKVIIKPTPCGDLSWVHATYNSVLGPISSNWALTGGTMTLNVGIPVGATATVYVPTSSTASVLESGVPASRSSGVQFISMQNGVASYSVGSGNYIFSSIPALIVPGYLSASPNPNSATLSWYNVAAAGGYNVLRATASGGPYTTIASNVTSPGYTDTGLIDGTTYFYVVVAVNSAGQSSTSNEVSVTPSPVADGSFETPVTSSYVYDPSGAPWTFSPQSGKNGSGLTSNDTTFNAGNPNAPDGSQVAFLQGTGSISQTITGLIEGATYYISFQASQRAVYVNGGQTWSVLVNGSTIASYAPGASATAYTEYSASFVATAGTESLTFAGTDANSGDNTVLIDAVRMSQSVPPAPGNLAAVGGNRQVSLQWSAISGVSSYSVGRATVSGGPYTTIANNITTHGYTDTNVYNGTTYYYIVVAVNGSGASSNSYETTATPSVVTNGGFEVPALVSGTYQYNPGGGVWLFSPQSGANGSGITSNSSIFNSGNPPAPQGIQVAFIQGTGVASQAIGGFTSGATYNISFLASERQGYVNGGQTWNVVVDGTTIASFAPGASAFGYESYTASFIANAAPSHMLAFVGTNANTGDNTVFIDNVQVVALPPPAPGSLNAVAGNGQVVLQWNSVDGIIGYHVYRLAGRGGGATIQSSATATTYTDTNVSNGASYTYDVSAFNDSGDGSLSNSVTAIPAGPVTAAEAIAPGLAVSGTGSGMNAGLTVRASVLGHTYQLQYCDDLSSGSWQNVANISPQAGTGGALQFTIPIDGEVNQRFYRIMIQP